MRSKFAGWCKNRAYGLARVVAFVVYGQLSCVHGGPSFRAFLVETLHGRDPGAVTRAPPARCPPLAPPSDRPHPFRECQSILTTVARAPSRRAGQVELRARKQIARWTQARKVGTLRMRPGAGTTVAGAGPQQRYGAGPAGARRTASSRCTGCAARNLCHGNGLLNKPQLVPRQTATAAARRRRRDQDADWPGKHRSPAQPRRVSWQGAAGQQPLARGRRWDEPPTQRWYHPKQRAARQRREQRAATLTHAAPPRRRLRAPAGA